MNIHILICHKNIFAHLFLKSCDNLFYIHYLSHSGIPASIDLIYKRSVWLASVRNVWFVAVWNVKKVKSFNIPSNEVVHSLKLVLVFPIFQSILSYHYHSQMTISSAWPSLIGSRDNLHAVASEITTRGISTRLDLKSSTPCYYSYWSR